VLLSEVSEVNEINKVMLKKRSLFIYIEANLLLNFVLAGSEFSGGHYGFALKY
jgi:hypothetical protein